MTLITQGWDLGGGLPTLQRQGFPLWAGGWAGPSLWRGGRSLGPRPHWRGLGLGRQLFFNGPGRLRPYAECSQATRSSRRSRSGSRPPGRGGGGAGSEGLLGASLISPLQLSPTKMWKMGESKRGSGGARRHGVTGPPAHAQDAPPGAFVIKARSK